MGRHVQVYTMELFTYGHESYLSLQIMLQQISWYRLGMQFKVSIFKDEVSRIPKSGRGQLFLAEPLFLLSDNVLDFYYIKLCFIIENGKQRLKNAHFQVGFF